MIRRREFITLLGGAAAWPLAARAQQADRVRRIGVLIGVADDAEGQARLAAFQKGMKELGWNEGREIQLIVRYTAGTAERARAYAAELVAMAPDAILANAAHVVSALRQQTQSVPIVFAQVVDPVSSGFVESLARPGGNVTGFLSSDYAMGAKWLEILKEVAPRVTRVGVLRDLTVIGGTGTLGAIQAAAPSFSVELKALDVPDAATIERGLSAFARDPNGGLIVVPNPGTSIHRELIIAQAARHRLPATYPYRYFVTAGGLISYGTDNLDLWRRAAGYIDRILKGEKPANLPVQQPTKFELVINLRTAKALGLEIPPMLLAHADEVIE
jgi:putative tryptophan/tyrosine transport system substrate-binding protein